jgi:hypothetical protein
MRTLPHLLPLTLATFGILAHAAPAAEPAAAPTHRTQPLRTGAEHPRNRIAEEPQSRSAARPETGTAGRVRVYQPAKPGEGAPKGQAR